MKAKEESSWHLRQWWKQVNATCLLRIWKEPFFHIIKMYRYTVENVEKQMSKN